MKKILTMLLLFVTYSNAAVFDYRIYYGSSTTAEDSIFSYSASVYSYFHESDFAYGAQIDAGTIQNTPSVSIISTSVLLGYDFTRTVHGEINGGLATRLAESSYDNGYHGAATLLMQSHLDSMLEAIQLGVTVKYDVFNTPGIKDELAAQIFLGFGF